MHISIEDGSHYFRGLLLLVSKDRQIAGTERDHLLRIGRSLGFEREFCETAIHEVLENSYLPPDPPRFSSLHLAEMFIRDGLAIATADHELHDAEAGWLRACAAANGIADAWVNAETTRAGAGELAKGRPLEVEALRMR